MIQIDDTDRRILATLQKEGRISNADLAERVNLSASACHRRVQRLEQAGVIAGYVALLDQRSLDRTTTVFVEITLSGQGDAVLDAFEKAVRAIPDVLECHLMAGTADYLLKVLAAFVINGVNLVDGANASLGYVALVSLPSFVLMVGITLLELLVAAIQAYVFALLTSVYLNDAVNLH